MPSYSPERDRHLAAREPPPGSDFACMFKCENENLPQPAPFNKIVFHNELGQTASPITGALPESFGIGLFQLASAWITREEVLEPAYHEKS